MKLSKRILSLILVLGIFSCKRRMVFEEYQESQEVVAINRVLPYYHPYISALDDSYYYPSCLNMSPEYSGCSESINKLRGGSRLSDAIWLFLYIWMLQHQSVGFQPVRQGPPPPNHQLFGNTQNNYFSRSSQPSGFMQLERPSAMPHQDFTGLTKEQRRNLPDQRDGFIDVEGHPKLIARYGQIHFKTPKHGKIHGLPVNENGRILKTEQNALALRDSLVQMPEREGNIWFDNGGYQKGTERGYDSVNLYDKDKRVIAVYRKKENGEYIFSTTCKLTAVEEAHLYKSNGNFVTEVVLKDPNYKNNY